jgi:hypothetical protein
MPTKPNSDLDQNLEQEIRDLLVSGIVSTDAEVRSALSHDLFFWDNIALPAMVCPNLG